MTPYTEWYDNAIRVPESPSAKFHRENFGNRPYEDFREPFSAGLEQWDPAEWARLFKQSGARYIVLVTKHHDGYCLWPSDVENPHKSGWTSERDVVGELAQAVRAEGIRFGIYYSGGIDWSFNPKPLRTLAQFIGSTPRGDYPDYAEAQVRELIDRYRPSLLWNDISWPSGKTSMLRLMADYYAAVPEGVINDRWMHRNWLMKLISKRPVQRLIDFFLSRATKRAAAKGEQSHGVVPPRPIHFDFRTPEYTSFDSITEEKWECTRGMSPSFGYNRAHEEADYEKPDDLIRSFIDAVSKNGNLLLNVGPRGVDASIPQPQVDRLVAMGEWLKHSGDAIYGTRPWTRAEGESTCSIPIRFTCRGDTVFAILLDTPSENASQISIRDFSFEEAVEVTYLATGQRIDARADGADLMLSLPGRLPEGPAHAFAITKARR